MEQADEDEETKEATGHGKGTILAEGDPGAGGRTTALDSTFMSACKRLHIEPFAYLRDALGAISAHSPKPLEELPQDNWKAARDATENLAA